MVREALSIVYPSSMEPAGQLLALRVFLLNINKGVINKPQINKDINIGMYNSIYKTETYI